MPHQDIYETEQRKSEFGIKQMIEDLIGKPVEPDKSSKIFTPESIINTIKQTVEKPEPIEIDFGSLYRLGLHNLGMCGENSCKGAMLNSYNMDEYLPILKQCGIQRIIDLTRNGDLEEECKSLNIEYMSYDLNSRSEIFTTKENYLDKIKRDIIQKFGEKKVNEFLKDSSEIWDNNVRLGINEFIKFINTMQKDYVYIGCSLGTDKTNHMLFFNAMFNPQTPEEPEQYKGSANECINYAETLYNKLIKEDKLKMGWTEEFEKLFLKRVKKFKRI